MGMRVFFICSIGGILAAATLDAAKIRVPADRPAIQEALDAAVEGDTVLVDLVAYEAIPEPSFIRGDPNGDREVDIADAVRILFHLFLGDPPLPCPRLGWCPGRRSLMPQGFFRIFP